MVKLQKANTSVYNLFLSFFRSDFVTFNIYIEHTITLLIQFSMVSVKYFVDINVSVYIICEGECLNRLYGANSQNVTKLLLLIVNESLENYYIVI